MAKEKGLPPWIGKKGKAADEKMDKAKGIKEGSKQDLKTDKSIAKKYGKK